jgi:D-beta-D-heptose 7-phosphate kinase/D-beta-D-heptose 1-phosphate adenosyltransferase
MDELRPHNENIAGAVRRSFGHKRVLVVGDLMLDRYMGGKVERISPEAPVPILNPQTEDVRAGGAGNVALNLRGLGLEVAIAGFTGSDENRERLLKVLAGRGIATSAVVALADRPTVTKTRITAGHQHVLRVDSEDLKDIRAEDHERLFEAVSAQLPADAIILSDYAKGVLSTDLCQRLIAAARDTNTPVLVDPKGLDYSKYAGATAVTPNLLELSRAGHVSTGSEGELMQAARSFVDTLGLEFLILTRGAGGITLVTAEQTIHSPARAREVFDVSGAGDTVIASIVAGLLGGLDYTDMLHMANLAAGYVVGRSGTVAIERTTLMWTLRSEDHSAPTTVYELDELLLLVEYWRSQNLQIVFTNGCFDIIHAGHVTLLHRAAREGDRLIVGINTDHSVRGLKGEGRPLNSQEDRALVVSALAAVDAAVLFDQPTPLELIEALHPDVIVKGADYSKEQVVGGAEVESWGGRVVLVPLVKDKSTSGLIGRISGK